MVRQSDRKDSNRGLCPSLSVTVDGAINRINSGEFAYDNDGNMTIASGLTNTFDMENRLVTSGSEA